MSEEERGGARPQAPRLEEARYVLVTVPPDTTERESQRYRDTLVTGAGGDLAALLERLAQETDMISGALTRPFTVYSAMTVPPYQVAGAYKTYMTALLLHVEQLLRGMVDEVMELYAAAASTRSPEDVRKLASSVGEFNSRARTLLSTVVVASQKLLNILARSMPPQLRSALVNESLGRMLVPTGGE